MIIISFILDKRLTILIIQFDKSLILQVFI
jgi:hypothetical protein